MCTCVRACMHACACVKWCPDKYGGINIDTYLTCSYNTILWCLYCGVGVNGQDPSVTIMPDPDMDFYTVGDNLTLTCIVDPLPTDTSITVTYLWQCSACFANGTTTPTITRILTDMDNSTIDCLVTIDGNVTMADMMFDLQVTQGIVLDILSV